MDHLRDSETSTEELEIILSSMELKEEKRNRIILCYLTNLVKMSKQNLVESISEIQKIFGLEYPIKNSALFLTLTQDSKKNESVKILRDLIKVIKTLSTLSKSGDYCLKCKNTGTSNSLINELMLDEKKVHNFGLQIDDLKSLKLALSIYEHLREVFKQELMEEKKHDLLELLISELLELQN